MADKNETFYYELDVFSQTDWSDHEHFAFTGPTYEAVMEKARKYNVDVTDLDRWNTTLYVTGDSTLNAFSIAAEEEGQLDPLSTPRIVS